MRNGVQLATITLKNVPRNVHERIKKRAERNRRSLNLEILACLESILGIRESVADELFANIEKAHAGLHFKATRREVQAAKIEGRK